MTKAKIKLWLGDAAFWRTCVRLALPIAIQNLLISSFTLVDTAMVSQLGGTALSAVGMAGQWAWLLNMFAFGIASGAAVFVSQYWGARDLKGIHRVTGMALIVGLVILIPFFLVAFISPSFVISLFNRDAAIVETGCAYLSAALWSYPAIMLNVIVSTVLRSTESVKLPMFVSGISMLMNAALNYVFIFGLGIIPAMGVRGAAIATVISAWAGPLLLIVISYVQKNALCAMPTAFFRFTAKEFKKVLARVLPVVFNEGLWGVGTWTISLIYANLGKDEYGGITIFKNFEMIAFAIIQGFGSACCVCVGKNIGAGETEQAVRDAKRFSVLVPLFSLGIGATLIALKNPILAFFNMSGTLSEITLATASGVILIFSIEFAVRNIPYIQIVGIFRSGGDTLAATLFDVGSLWLLAIPTALFTASLGMPFLAVVALVYLCEDWPKATLCLFRFKSGKWIKPVTKEGVEGHKKYLASQALAKKGTNT